MSRVCMFICLVILVVGCSRPAPTQPATPSAGEWAGRLAVNSNGQLEGIPGGWTLSLDASTLTAEAVPWRSTSNFQGLLFDLDITNFITPATLRVSGLSVLDTGDFRLDYRITHPYAAPNFAAPVSGKNRADLGLTGRLLFLMDVPTAQVPERSFFGGTRIANTDTILNANHYVDPGDLLVRNTGLFNADVFPTRLIADEALNGGQGNRIAVPNGGNPHGNYNAANGGWQRSNIGPANRGWTGFDVLHQGQSAANHIIISQDALAAGSFSFDAAMLIKYTSPMGVPYTANPQARFPQDPFDTGIFAYRYPAGALDASDIAFEDLPSGALRISANQDDTVSLTIRVRDWDYAAVESSEPVLSDDPDISKVHLATSGPPVVSVSIPALATEPFPTGAPTGGTGLPGDELLLQCAPTNLLGTAVSGTTVYGLVRVEDPEHAVGVLGGYHFGVDPNTIVPDAARALDVISYQALPVDIVPPAGSGLLHDAVLTLGGPNGVVYVVETFVDELGNLYLAGNFQGTVDFDPGPGTQPRTSDSQDCFVQSLDQDLLFRWVSTWGGTGFDQLTALAEDTNVNLAAVGSFQGEVDFDPGPGSDLRTAQGVFDAFCLQLDKLTGDYDWAETWGGPSYCRVENAEADFFGDIYFTGEFSDIVDFDPSGGIAERTSNGQSDAYLLSLNAGGGFRWIATLGGPQEDQGRAVTISPFGNVHLTGQFSGEMDIDPGAGTVLKTSNGNDDIFVLQLTRAGAFNWGQTVGGPFTDVGQALATDLSNNVYVAGTFNLTVDFDPGPGVDSRSANGANDNFLWSLSPTGSHRLVAAWGGSLPDDATSVAIQPGTGNIAVAGRYFGTVDFDPGPGGELRNSNGGSDAYLLLLNPDGSLQGVSTWGGTGFDYAFHVLLPLNGKGYISGSYADTVDFDPGPGVVERTAQGLIDGYLLVLAPG